jgi:hypothetical protein
MKFKGSSGARVIRQSALYQYEKNKPQYGYIPRVSPSPPSSFGRQFGPLVHSLVRVTMKILFCMEEVGNIAPAATIPTSHFIPKIFFRISVSLFLKTYLNLLDASIDGQ